MQRRVLTAPKLVAWYAVAIAVGTYGSWGAYHGRFTSEAWVLWAAASAKGVDPTVLDVVRLFVAAICASYALVCVGAVSADGRNVSSLAFTRTEKIVTGVVIGLLGIAAFVLLPANFYHEYQSDVRSHFIFPTGPQASWFSPRQISFPYYFPYSLYVYALWLAIIYPLFLFAARSLAKDRAAWKQVKVDLSAAPELSAIGLSAYRLKVLNDAKFLTDCANRYIPVALAAILASLIEHLSNLYCSTLPASADLGMMALWVLWIPSLFLFGSIYVVAYNQIFQIARSALVASASLARTRAESLPAAEQKDMFDLATQATDQVEHIDSGKTPWAAMLEVLKGGQVLAALFVVFIGLLTKYLVHDQREIAGAFFPSPWVEWVDVSLLRHPSHPRSECVGPAIHVKART